MVRIILTVLLIEASVLGANVPADQHEHAADAGISDGMHHKHRHHHGSLSGHWTAPAKEAKRRNPVKADDVSVNGGKELFQAHCASCHGENGEGDGPAAAAPNPKPANLKAMAPHHADGDLAWKIANGRGAMPAWKGTLKQKQIWDLVNYIKQLGGS